TWENSLVREGVRRGRRSGYPGRPDHRGGCYPSIGMRLGWSRPRRAAARVRGLLIAQGRHHSGFLVVGVVAVKRPLAGVVGDQVGDHGFMWEHEDGVLAQSSASLQGPGLAVDVHRVG